MIKDHGESRLNHENSTPSFSLSEIFFNDFIGALTCQVLLWGNVNGLFCFSSSYLYAVGEMIDQLSLIWRAILCVLIMSSQTLTHSMCDLLFQIRRKKNFNQSFISQNDLISLKTGWSTRSFQRGSEREHERNNNPGKVSGLLFFFLHSCIYRCTLQHADLLFSNK